MSYKFAIETENYEDYSSGRVLYNQKGATSFPVRLGSEIFQRCAKILTNQGLNGPYVIYDPCCGGAYLLTLLGYLHGEKISKIYASDIDEAAISLAQRNLSLLRQTGLDERIKQIEKMIVDFGKQSHLEALSSAFKLRDILDQRNNCIDYKCFTTDITREVDLYNSVSGVNIIITDLPYGEIVNWSGIQSEEEAIEKLLDNVLPVVAKDSVISVVSRKKTKIKHKKYMKSEQFIIGKRQVIILQPVVG